jgi:hypothetical protein
MRNAIAFDTASWRKPVSRMTARICRFSSAFLGMTAAAAA